MSAVHPPLRDRTHGPLKIQPQTRGRAETCVLSWALPKACRYPSPSAVKGGRAQTHTPNHSDATKESTDSRGYREGLIQNSIN